MLYVLKGLSIFQFIGQKLWELMTAQPRQAVHFLHRAFSQGKAGQDIRRKKTATFASATMAV
jgi:hypothetical protein